jgi:nanoRNase/pAp phosphatase (c-di-AMP/oligoRNAs hydrolase)
MILGHHNADPDAICSMLAFGNLCTSINPSVEIIYACDDISKVARKVIDSFDMRVEVIETIDRDYDLYILMDANSKYQLGPSLEQKFNFPEKTIVIDHHEENPEIEKITDMPIVQSDRFSTCEILVELYNTLQLQIPPEIANLLLAGILFDTRRFYYSDRKTMNVATTLLDAGADYSACLESLVIRPDRSERIARLKAAGRLRVETIGEWVIVTSKIGAYEASACRGLIDLGADVAIIGGKPSKGIVRISSRSTSEFFKETRINLGTDIMEPIGVLIGGEGGGHANAAGANGTHNLDAALNRSVELIKEALEKQNASNQ